MLRTRIALLVIAVALPLVAQQPRRGPMSAEQVRGLLPAGVEWTPDIAYRDGNDAWKLDVAYPSGEATTPRPGMVFVHGGGWRNGDKRQGQWARLPLMFAERGYVAISVNYRMKPDVTIRGCVEDVKNAVRWLRAHSGEYGLDPDKIGAYGNSAGAHLVAMLGLVDADAGLDGDGPYAKHSSRVQAVLASATPTDFPHWSQDRGDDRPNPASDGDDERRALSPISYVRADAPPFLLIHGNADRTVPIAQSERFAKALREAGATQVRLVIFDDNGHGVFQQQQLLTYPAMVAFFAETLKGELGNAPSRNRRTKR